MLTCIAWSFVAASFLLLGFSGYASVTRGGTRRFLGTVISVLALNAVASQIFSAVEIGSIKEFGTLQEDQMQPDMPNLIAGLILYGWAFFAGGFFAGKLRNQVRAGKQGDPEP